ncbi:MAG: hypothetical protein Q7R91_01630 [bacterium]|nr:hypothetical protein [bacterium]
MKFFLSLLVLGVLLFASGAAVKAQFAENLSIAIDVASPQPGQTINAKALLSTNNPAQATFQWLLNGKGVPSASGMGKDTFTFTMPTGSRTAVDVVVVTSDGTRLEATKAITLAKAVIVWWADTSVPIWYQGKAISSTGSTATLYAIPGTGFNENPSTLFYFWTINLEAHPEVSGVGRNSFDLKVSLAENVTHQINVRISNATQTITQEAMVLLQTKTPELMVYQLTPTGGVDFSQMLSIFNGNSGETYDFIAEPFFFRPDQIKVLKFSWQLNDKTLEGDFTKPNILTLETTSGGTSQNTVQVDASGLGTNTQESSTFFTANFR